MVRKRFRHGNDRGLGKSLVASFFFHLLAFPLMASSSLLIPPAGNSEKFDVLWHYFTPPQGIADPGLQSGDDAAMPNAAADPAGTTQEPVPEVQDVSKEPGDDAGMDGDNAAGNEQVQVVEAHAPEISATPKAAAVAGYTRKQEEAARKAAREAAERLQERRAAEQTESLRLAALKTEEARLAAEAAERRRHAAEAAAAEMAEQEMAAAEQAESMRLAAVKADEERSAKARAEEARHAADTAERYRKAVEEATAEKRRREKLAEEKATRLRLAAVKSEEELAAKARAEEARHAAEAAERSRKAAEEAAAERRHRERAAAERAEKLRMAEERVTQERLRRERADRERHAAEKVAAGRRAVARSGDDVGPKERSAVRSSLPQPGRQTAALQAPAPPDRGATGQAAPGEGVKAVPEPTHNPVAAIVENPGGKASSRDGVVGIPVRGDLILEVKGEETFRVTVVFREYATARRKRPMTKAESQRRRNVIPVVAKIGEKTRAVMIETAEAGIYDFFAEPAGSGTSGAEVVLKVHGSGGTPNTRSIGKMTVTGKTGIVRILMPEGILWDDEAAFSGSMEDSESFTRFNSATGLVWREYR